MECSNTFNEILNSMCGSCFERMFQNTLEYNLNKNAKRLKQEGCGICFGILKEFSENEFIEKIKDTLLEKNIEFENFRLSVSIPNLSIIKEKFIEFSCNEDESFKNAIKKEYCSIKDFWKNINLKRIEEILDNKKYSLLSPFEIKISFSINELDDDLKLMGYNSCFNKDSIDKLLKKNAEVINQDNNFSKQNVETFLCKTTYQDMKKYYKLPLDLYLCNFEIDCSHDPIYMAGRYIKYSRVLPQSPWLIDGIKKLDTSIEEIIGNVLKEKIGSSVVTFTAAGREDIDVRCLGKGRPFIFELHQPKRTKISNEDLRDFQKKINESTNQIEVRELQELKKDQIKLIKEGETKKTKSYSALCFTYTKIEVDDIEKLNLIKSLVISQNTPIRVMHRRTLIRREKQINELKAEYIDGYHFRINLRTQAGTYIKEFVHGDLGRTNPSISTLLNRECDILELDVTEIDLELPNLE